MKPKTSEKLPENSEKIKKFTPRQQRFIDEYLIDLNGTQAAIRAGYKANSANEQAAYLLAQPSIKSVVEARKVALSSKMQLSAEWVVDRLKEISSRCMAAEPVLNKEGKPIGQWRFDSMGANKALENIGKYLGMFTERVEVNNVSHKPNTVLIDYSKFDRLTYQQLKIMNTFCKLLDEKPMSIEDTDILEAANGLFESEYPHNLKRIERTV
jgi:phage terminase small subunit